MIEGKKRERLFHNSCGDCPITLAAFFASSRATAPPTGCTEARRDDSSHVERRRQIYGVKWREESS